MKKVTIILTASYFLFSCNNNSKNEIQQAKQMAIDSMQQQAEIRQAKQSVIDSMTLQANIQKAKQHTLDSIQADKKVKQSTSSAKISKPEAFVSNTNSSSTVSEKSTTVVQSKKKKSKKIGRVAQGAIIGAGVGALSGAVISRNNKPGKGALIGGIIGAGVGAGTGAVIDKKQKQKEN